MILYIDLPLQCSFVVFLVLAISECRDCLCRRSSTSSSAFDRRRQSTFVCESASGLSLSFSVHTCHPLQLWRCRIIFRPTGRLCIRRSSQPIGGRSTTDSFSQQTFLWPPYAFERPCVPVCVVFCQSDSQMSQVLSKRLVYLAHMPQGAVNCSNACCFASLNACVSVSNGGFEHKWGNLGPRCRKLKQMRENMGSLLVAHIQK